MAKDDCHKHITIKPQRKPNRTSLRKPKIVDSKPTCVHVGVPQQPSQSKSETLATVIQPDTSPTTAPGVSVLDQEFDHSNPATSVLHHITTAT